ncbi:hypothetical protein U9M48_000790 [Paspalum notatum var. saurae]|uniref:Uncharacterized protein n=1 Tax=Paspalum notatum var. saurae TaxID=547442 RepID=A0AAQ3SHN1_PASNO
MLELRGCDLSTSAARGLLELRHILEKIGPFRIKPNGTFLFLNKYSRNRGHYVPKLARKIIEYNKASPRLFINQIGILVKTYAEKYYNRLDVQKATHANTTRIPYRWTASSDVLIKAWQELEFSMLPTHRTLIKAGLRIWVFSGDTDFVVPVTARRFAINNLGRGLSEVYEGLKFASVRGAGHEVSLFQPRGAFRMFQAFLAGVWGAIA